MDARRKYNKALRYYEWMLKQTDLPDTLDSATIQEMKIAILSNLAAVKLKEGQYRDALNFCNEVNNNNNSFQFINKITYFINVFFFCLLQILELDLSNSKALFRRGQAHMGLNEYELGLADFKQANFLCPNNKEITKEIDKVKQIMQNYLAVEKAACKRMFK